MQRTVLKIHQIFKIHCERSNSTVQKEKVCQLLHCIFWSPLNMENDENYCLMTIREFSRNLTSESIYISKYNYF